MTATAMTASTTARALHRLYGSRLTPAARSEVINDLAALGNLRTYSDSEVIGFVRDRLASEVYEVLPGIEPMDALAVADQIHLPWALLDPTVRHCADEYIRRIAERTITAPATGPAPF